MNKIVERRKRAVSRNNRIFACGCVQVELDEVEWTHNARPICAKHHEFMVGYRGKCQRCGKLFTTSKTGANVRYCKLHQPRSKKRGKAPALDPAPEAPSSDHVRSFLATETPPIEFFKAARWKVENGRVSFLRPVNRGALYSGRKV